MEEMRDEEIADGVQKGDAESFGILVERYEAKMLRYGKKFLSDRQDIKDIVQEVFIKAYVNIKSFDTARKFSSWLYRIAHNEFVNALKKKKRMPLMFDFDAIFPHPFASQTPDKDTDEKEIRRMLDKCLNKIDPKYREPMVLYYFEEISYQEIAEILHIPVSTVGVRLNRAKAILKDVFNKIYPDR